MARRGGFRPDPLEVVDPGDGGMVLACRYCRSPWISLASNPHGPASGRGAPCSPRVLVALVVVPVVAMGAWLVIADPAVAADVAAEGDLWPIVRAIVETVRDAFRDLLRCS